MIEQLSEREKIKVMYLVKVNMALYDSRKESYFFNSDDFYTINYFDENGTN